MADFKTLLKHSLPKNSDQVEGWASYTRDAMFAFGGTGPLKQKIIFLFGDRNTHELPALCKTRLRSPKDKRGILWPMNVQRHFGPLAEVAKNDLQWNEKTNTLVWRGTYTGEQHGSRLHTVVTYSGVKGVNLGITKWINKKFIFNGTAASQDDFVAYKQPTLTMSQLLTYKYLLAIEGNDVSSGLKWMLMSNSVVFMAEPTWESWAMEDWLEPWIHYIPLNKNHSDLLEKLQWAKDHDEQAKMIAQRATLFLHDLMDTDEWGIITSRIRQRYYQLYGDIGNPRYTRVCQAQGTAGRVRGKVWRRQDRGPMVYDKVRHRHTRAHGPLKQKSDTDS
jgi:hypothetical protein